jgi:hypothetical protein
MARRRFVSGFVQRAAVVLSVVASTTFALADDPKPDTGTVPSDPEFTAQPLRGPAVAGRIKQLGPRGEVVLVPNEGTERTLPLRQLLKLTREKPTATTAAEGTALVFSHGDRLLGCSKLAATETSLEVSHEALGNLSIPLDSLVAFILAPPPDADALDAVFDRVRHERRSSEVLWLANGDRLAGDFLGLDDTKVKFQTENGSLSVEQSGVLGVGFDPAILNEHAIDGLFLELTLLDRSRLSVTGARVEQGSVVATTRFGMAIRVPLAHLAAVHVRSDAFTYLSEREADKSQYVPYVGPTRPYRRNLSAEGHTLRLGGESFDRGLGTQSRTFLAYRLSGGDQRFQALIGLDDRAGPLGSVVFRVLVDEKEAYSSAPMSARDTPRAIDIDVAGAKVLVLVADFGERGGVRDLADWVEARLVR